MKAAFLGLILGLMWVLCACQQPESAAEDFPNLKPPPCDCIRTSARWYGSTHIQCGAAGGMARAFRIDPDSTVPNLSRAYLITYSVASDSLWVGRVFNGSTGSAQITFEILAFDSNTVHAEFGIANTANDSSVSGRVDLENLGSGISNPCL
jgi:hypothetical protein